MSKTLYRDPANGKIAGVCAGLAEYLGIEVGLVRVLVIAIAIFSMGFLAVFAYIAAVFVLEKKPIDRGNPKAGSFQSSQAHLEHIERRMRDMEMKVAHMEAYVTSSEFDLIRKFKQL